MDSTDPLSLAENEYSFEEFFDKVAAWRTRYAVNELATYPPMRGLKYFEDKRVVYLPDRVRLEEI